MNITTYSEARANFKRVMDETCKSHEPTVIARAKGEHVVMLSMSDYSSIQETLYLMSSPRNASRLMESIAQIKSGQAVMRELIPHEEQES